MEWLTTCVWSVIKLKQYHCVYSVVIVHSVRDCGTPPTVTNGAPGTPTSTLQGGKVTYTCDPGYEVSTGVSSAVATCGSDGDWANVPTCTGEWCVFIKA